MDARSYQLRICIGVFAEFMALEKVQLRCVHGLVCQLQVMRMIPTVYGPPRNNMVCLVNFNWMYMRLSFSACSVENIMILSGVHIHTLQKQPGCVNTFPFS